MAKFYFNFSTIEPYERSTKKYIFGSSREQYFKAGFIVSCKLLQSFFLCLLLKIECLDKGRKVTFKKIDRKRKAGRPPSHVAG